MKGARPNLKAVDGGLLKAPAMPGHLPSDMRDVWRTTAADLIGRGLLTTSSLPLLETYVGAVWMAKECRGALAEHGVLVRGEKMQFKPNPAAAMLAKAQDTIARLAADMGISAASRNSNAIRAAQRGHGDEQSGFSNFDL
jgi:P27 family predicted phage terminase small subunit